MYDYVWFNLKRCYIIQLGICLTNMYCTVFCLFFISQVALSEHVVTSVRAAVI